MRDGRSLMTMMSSMSLASGMAIVTPAGQGVSVLPRCSSPCMTERAEGSLDRRAASGIAALTLLNICSLTLRKEPLPVITTTRWDPEAAIVASKGGAACPTVSCADARFAEVNSMLDTSGVKSNAKGAKEDRLPIIYLETAFGMRGSAAMAQYHVVMVSPVKAGDDRVQLMWLRDAQTGRVVAARSFDEDSQQDPPTLVGTLKQPYAGVREGETLVPLILYERDGLWVGDPFTLCAPDSAVCDGPGLLKPSRIISTANKRGATQIGADVLAQVRPAARSATSRSGTPRMAMSSDAGCDQRPDRRSVVGAVGRLLPLPLLAQPRMASALPRLPDLMAGLAGPGGVQLFGPSGELGRLNEARMQLAALSGNLETGVYKANTDDSIVVLKLSAIYFKSTPGLMNVTTEAMDLLAPAEVAKAASLTAAFDDAVKVLEQGCRDQDLARQKEGCATANGLLTKYLELASLHYTVPSVSI